MITVTVHQFLKDQQKIQSIECLTGQKGLDRKVAIPQIQKPGLALTGDTSALNPGRIQIFGNAEIQYLRKLNAKQRSQIIQKICQAKIPCILVTNQSRIPKTLKALCVKYKIPLFVTPLSTAISIIRTQRFLEQNLTESMSLHAVFVDIYGIGVLLLGKSGIGKSECALELVTRGHRLVADDIVNVRKQRPETVFGVGSDVIKYHMEIRGLGIINIKDLFGVASVQDSKNIELVIELVEWDPEQEYERVGIDEPTYELLGVQIPYLQIPVRPGRSLSTIIEVAARNQLLKFKGLYSARQFQDRLLQDLLTGALDKKTIGLND